MEYTAPVQYGIHMTEEEEQFYIAVSIINPTDEEIDLHRMTDKPFGVRIKGDDPSTGYDELWRPNRGLTHQSETGWRLEPNSEATRHYEVPNLEQARMDANQHIEEFEPDMSVDGLLGQDYPYVEPDDVGVVQVRASVPSKKEYGVSVSRQFDLRDNRDRVLDDELPPENMEPLSSSWDRAQPSNTI